eukprot:547729-Rhodomonas_salina.1
MALRAWYRLPGTDAAYGGTPLPSTDVAYCGTVWPYVRGTGCPVLTLRMMVPCSRMSGTDVAYDGTRTC